MKHWLHQLAENGISLAFPRVCLHCARPAGGGGSGSRPGYCGVCRDEISPDVPFSCQRCGAEVGPFTKTSDGCRHCRGRKLAFSGVSCLGMYDGLLKTQLLRGKSSHSSLTLATLGTLLGEQLRRQCRPPKFGLVLPVPQHWTQRLARRQNTAETVARQVSRALEVPLHLHILRRHRLPRAQKRVAVDERFRNQADTFRVRDRLALESRDVLLVDDVLTTGATCSEAARLLRQHGAASCHVAVLARVLDGSA